MLWICKKVYEWVLDKGLELKLIDLEVKRFKDGEEKIKITESVRGTCCFFIHDSNKEPPKWFMELAFVNEALRNSSASEIINVLPYLKFSRQERNTKKC